MRRAIIVSIVILTGCQYVYSQTPELNGSIQPIIQQLQETPLEIALPVTSADTPAISEPNGVSSTALSLEAEKAIIEDLVLSLDALRGTPCYDMNDVRELSDLALKVFGKVADIGIKTQYPENRDYVLRILNLNYSVYSNDDDAWRKVAVGIKLLIADVKLNALTNPALSWGAERTIAEDLVTSLDAFKGARNKREIRELSDIALKVFGKVAEIGIKTQYPENRSYVINILDINYSAYYYADDAWEKVAVGIKVLIADVLVSARENTAKN